VDLQGWEQRYRSTDPSDGAAAPAPLVIETASPLEPGAMLDLACGTGRHAIWFAERGWSVTAVDGSPAAIDILRRRAGARHSTLAARVADLEKHEFVIGPAAWDLILIWLYLQRDIIDPAKRGVKPGGVLIASVRTVDAGADPGAHRLRPGELQSYFRDWEILHYAEGTSIDPGHEHSVAEIVARRGNPAARPVSEIAETFSTR